MSPRIARLALTAVAVALFAPPATAQANQTLTVEKAGSGSGTVTSSPAGINCGATCSFAFADNAVVLLTGASAAGSAPVIWSGCDTVTVEKKCKVAMSAAKTVKATFNLLKRQLTVSRKGTGTGTVTSSPAGIECGATCTAEYDNGTEVTLTGLSGPNTEAVKWAGCTSVDGENHCKVTMSAAKSVSATFNLAKRELKVTKGGLGTGTVTSSPTGIACGSTCFFVFGAGQTITLTGTPTGETEAVKWSGCDSVSAENKCLVTMSSAREVTALFNVEGPTLTVAKLGSGTGTVTSSPAAIECGSACAVNFPKGTTVTLTGAAGFHSEAVKWSGCDTVTIEDKCLVAMNAARAVTANFDLDPQYVEYTVSVRLKGTGQGTVASVPGGIECGSDCSETYVSKTRVTLIATPAPGSVFDHWSGGSCAGTGPCEKTINSSRLINAVFVAAGKRTLSVAKAGTGSGTVSSNTGTIDCGNTCSAEIDAAGKITLSATPAAGSTFAGWSGACTGTGKCKLAMNEARTITASFEKIPPASSVLLIAGNAKVRQGKAKLKLTCSGGSSCRGTLKLLLKTRNARGQVKGLVVASAPFDLAAGTSKTLEMKLSPRAKRLLGGAGSLRVRVTGTGIEPHAVRLTA